MELAASLSKDVAALWSLYHETPFSQTGLVLELQVVPTAIHDYSQRSKRWIQK